MRRAAFFALIGLCLVQSASATPAEDAASWLVRNHGADGSWRVEGGEDYRVFVVASALRGLMDYSNGTGDAQAKRVMEAGNRWLAGQESTYTMALSASIMVLGDAHRVKALADMQNSDGGWGKAMGFESNPLYTSRAALALMRYPEQRERVSQAGKYLVAAQEKSGAWENSALSTSAAVYALANSYAVDPVDSYIVSARKGAEWLMESQRRTNSWIDVPSAAEAVMAFRAMHALLDDDAYAQAAEAAENWLIVRANSDGSWGAYMAHSPGPGDVFATARALSALTVTPRLPSVEPKLIPSISASASEFMVGDSIAIAIKISNEGLFGAKDLVARLEPSWGLDEAVAWRLENLPSDSSAVRESRIIVPKGVVGEHLVRLSGRYSRLDGKGGVFALPDKAAAIRILAVPLSVELDPKMAREGDSEVFKLKLINLGQGDLRIMNMSWSIDGAWAVNGSTDAGAISLPMGSSAVVRLFEGEPPARGSYKVRLSLRALHPGLGDRLYNFVEEISVTEATSAIAKAEAVLLFAARMPSSIYNFIILATLAAALLLTLNLLFGIDIAR